MGGWPALNKVIFILAATLLIGLGTVEAKDVFDHENAKNVAHKELDRGGSNQEIASRIFDKLATDEDNVVFFVGVYDQVWGYHEHTISYSTSRTVVEYRYQGKNYVIYGTTPCTEDADACSDSYSKAVNNYNNGMEGFQWALDKLPSGPDGSKKIVDAAKYQFDDLNTHGLPPMILVVKADNNLRMKYKGTAAITKKVEFDGDDYVLVLGYKYK